MGCKFCRESSQYFSYLHRCWIAVTWMYDTNCFADTQDEAHEEVQTARVKEWINSRHISTFDLADVLSNFPDISLALTDDIMERLLKEGFVLRVGKDSYSINKEKESNPLVCDVKQEVEMRDIVQPEKVNKSNDEDYLYMKALYHALPMDYVTTSKLQNKLEGEANQNTVRKLIDKMNQDGYVKSSGNKRLGMRVIHSESSNRKLLEVKRIIEGQLMEIETKGQPFEFIPTDIPPSEHNVNGSTCGGVHSIGSDMTRIQGQSEANQIGYIHSGQPSHSTPTNKAVPIASLESGVAGKEAKRRASDGGDDSNSTQDKRLRKSSMVKEPILQYVKHQKSHA